MSLVTLTQPQGGDIKESEDIKMKNEYMDKLIQEAQESGIVHGRGTLYALRAYHHPELVDGVLVVNDLGFDSTIKDMMATFEAAGINELIITDHSSALMVCLHTILTRGWTITGTYTKEPEDKWDRKEYGLRIQRL